MINRLLLVASLLLPGIAYAANPSATLSVQIVPAAVATGAPTPPAQATVANFDTCVLCMDFTAPSGGVWVNGSQLGGVNAAQVNTWLDCAGASNPLWYQKSAGGASIAGMPCPDIRSDGTHNVLHESNLSNITGNVPNGTAQSIQTVNGTNGWMPANLYFEATYWYPTYPSVSNFYFFGWGNWIGGDDTGGNTAGHYNQMEYDANEINYIPNVCASKASNMFSWSTGGVDLGTLWFGVCPSYDFDSHAGYHTVGLRITSNGTTVYKCEWVDSHFEGCTAVTADGLSLLASQLNDSGRMNLMLSLGSNGSGSDQGSGADIYYMSANIWACSAWQSTACLTSNADPGGY